MELANAGIGQPTCLAVGQVLQPQAVKRGKHDLAAVRRSHRAPDLSRSHHLGGIDLVRELHLWADRELHRNLERNLGRFSPGRGHVPDLAAVGDDDRSAIRRERVSRQQIERSTRLLIVPLHRIGQPGLFTGFEVALPEACLAVLACAVDQPTPVWRNRRSER